MQRNQELKYIALGDPAGSNNSMHGPGPWDKKTGVNSYAQYHPVRTSPPTFLVGTP